MKVNKINSYNQNAAQKRQPAFKSALVLNFASNMMQGIERQGYLLSFLIQDGLGMTFPRVLTGFNRDKDITGEYNIQEGLEVFGREGTTGPYIILVAPFMLWLTSKFCKSTNTNTVLIKRLGNSLKELIVNPEFEAEVKKDKQKFKKEFVRHTIKSIYQNSVPNDKNADKTIDYILKEFENISSKDKKVSKGAYNNINKIVNEKITETSSDFYKLNKLIVGNANNKATFGTKEVLRALNDFADDAIINNKNSNIIDVKAVENIKNNFAAKRLFTNIANIVVTLGGLSILPKLYARSDVAPGVRTMEIAQSRQENNSDQNKGEIAFKGKGINGNNLWSKIGDLITKYTPEKLQRLLEYEGYNFTKTTFACLALFGLLLPRGKRAWDRAPVDENGKRDMTEINEILLRDTISSLSVVFAVPMLTKIIVSSYENKLGYILTNRASENKNVFRKALDVINPYSKLEVLSIADLDEIYGNIDTKAKLLNFADFVDKNGGDLQKIISRSENTSAIFNDSTFTLDSIKNLSKQEKNKKIKSLFQKIDSPDINAKNELISKLMKGSGDIKHNNIAKLARGLNSLPGFISTVIISPIILGWLIPKLTYYNTRKAHKKMMSEHKDEFKRT